MPTRRSVLVFLAAGAGLAVPTVAQGFDSRHSAWDALLKRHVMLATSGNASRVRYAGFAAERDALKRYLDALSSVSASVFAAFAEGQQKAFLINAYNAFTVALILERYPGLSSIKDLGSILQGPWKRKFVPLLGGKMSLDDIEHGMLRARGRYDDPRIHFAVNCASVGCPMLRDEAFVADRLEAQLDDQARRFMSDRSRNRWNPAANRLEVSRIFDWYEEDFRLGHRAISSAAAFYARHADQLADAPADRDRIRSGQARVAYLEYDWSLNDASE